MNTVSEAAFALSRECDMVILHGRATKKPDHHRLRRALSDLGFDLSRDSVRHRNYSAVLNGGHSIPACRSDHVCDRTVAGHQ